MDAKQHSTTLVSGTQPARTEERYQESSQKRYMVESEAPAMPQGAAPQVTLGRLADTLAHDLCNPFNAIFLHADLLEEDLQQLPPHTNGQMLSSLAEIKAEVTRVYAIVQDYLTLARLDELTYQPEILETTVEICGMELQEFFEARRLTLHCEGLERLGHVAMHRTTLQRALSHLLRQAAHATPEGGRLTVRGRQEGPRACLDVCDAGQGIPEAALPVIFEPWGLTPAEGTGLELYVARAIAMAHGGDLTVQSTSGQGTTFTMVLPCVEGR